MGKVLRKISVVLLALTAAIQLAAVPASAESSAAPAYDGYLVKFSDSLRIPAAWRAQLDRVVPELYKFDSQALIKPLLDSGIVEYIEPDYYFQLCDTSEAGTTGADSGKGWAYDVMNAESAKTLGLDGSGVRIGIIDSGLDKANADLKNATIAEGWNYKTKTTDTTDTFGHGTCVAEMIAGDDNSLGTTGIAAGATIVPLKCFSDQNDGLMSDIIQAVTDAAEKYDCDVINMSLGISKSIIGATDLTSLDTAVTGAIDDGVTVVAAAGNKPAAKINEDGSTEENTDNAILYPAACEGVIGVGSVDSSLASVDTSRKNATVDVCAPGGRTGDMLVFSALSTSSATVEKSGTSFAAPCVAAAAALAKQAYPGASPAEVEALLEGRAEDLGDPGRDDKYGYGFVDLGKVFGASWCSAVSGDDCTLHVGGFAIYACSKEQSAGCTATAAVYAQNGRLAAARTASVTAGVTPLSFDFTGVPDGALAKVFFVDSSFTPVSEPAAAQKVTK
jgi:subtilisin family serine protease